MDIFGDISKEVEFFFHGLNWTFILIYTFILYGMKNKEEFRWYNELFDSNRHMQPFKVWVAGIITMLIFCLFKYLETGINAEYISQMLRSWIIVIVFNSVFSKKIDSAIDGK